MKKKVAEYIADFLAAQGVRHVFTVTGGGAMYLNDAFGHHSRLACIYNHHEQASAIAAEGYARMTGRIAAVCVTSGPGGTNAITGVLGGWLDSIPMFVVSGQVKRETTIHAAPDLPLRQLGDQEYNIIDSVRPMTKYAAIILEPQDILKHLERAFYLATHGRPGPVWLDVPLDVQSALVDVDSLAHADLTLDAEHECPAYDDTLTEEILLKLRMARRPLLLLGTGVRLAQAQDKAVAFAEKARIPIVTAWNAHDLLPDNHELNCGRPGSVGTRGGNFNVQNCDVLLVLGCRMNIRMISYSHFDFARNAEKIVVDIDAAELRKPTVKIDMPVHADLRDVLDSLLLRDLRPLHSAAHEEWIAHARATHLRYPAVLPEYRRNVDVLNPYVFIGDFTKRLRNDDQIVCGNGSACVIGFQAAVVKTQTRLFTNSGCAAMGYGFPAAIGACVARNGVRVICLDGDGSFQMNLQELQTVVYNKLNLKIIYLNNNGYHSIRQTQTNLFKGHPLVGVCDGNGLSFPDAERLATAYGIPFFRVTRETDIPSLITRMEPDGPFFAEIVVDSSQGFSPKLSSKRLPDGTMVSAPLEDMAPFLSREELRSNMGFVKG